VEGELDRLRGLFRQKEQEILLPVKQKFNSMEEKLIRITNYFEAKL